MSDYENHDDLPLFKESVHAAGSVIERHELPSDATVAAKRAKMLDIFATVGTISTYEAERVMHRGQAVIGELRAIGHDIQTVDSTYVYISGPSDDLQRVTKAIQDAYYATPHWRGKREARKSLDLFECLQCKAGINDMEKGRYLVVHHWKYDLFNEHLDDLATLCNTCHDTLHDRIKGSQVHFPRKLTAEMIERIVG